MELATHNLRHSTSALWMEHGATDDDMKLLFAHSDPKVTARYIHYQTSRHLSRVANVIRLFPTEQTDDKHGSQVAKYPTALVCSTDVPCTENLVLKEEESVS